MILVNKLLVLIRVARISSSSQESAAVTTAAKLAFLRRAGSYPDNPHRVTCIETHYAWVFVSRQFAYKLKKPVRTAWFDYTTVSARYADACNEVTLNRRLAHDVYLGVVPLSMGSSDSLSLDGSGTAIDWLVKMRRLPPQLMLDRALRDGRVEPARIDAVGELLARFWVEQPSESMSANAYLNQLADSIADNAAYLRCSAQPVRTDIEDLECRLNGYLRSQSTVFSQRLADGCVKELHGDLRPEHVCLSEPPVVIDCLQFSRALRVLDIVDELAFLTLECEIVAGGWVEAPILRHYRQLSKDEPPASLIDFYKGCRALLRAKLAVGHLVDCPAARRTHWLSIASVYLRYAHAYATSALRVAS